MGDDRKEDEVTPEMMEAGVDCFYDLPELLGPSGEELRSTLKKAFQRMIEVRLEQRCEALPRDHVSRECDQ